MVLGVFDDERTSISRMYRELACQHHLVQERFDERPDIPGLTPVGFERWVTMLIQAHPDEEFERLQKAVLDMPISNPDDKKERFPKDISRRLFPGFPDLKIREDLENAISEHANIDLPNRAERDESPSHKRSINESVHSIPGQRSSAGVEAPTPNNIERERKPYVNSQLNCAVENTNPYPSPPPPTTHRASVGPESTHLPPSNIERERKPYASVPAESAIDDTNPYPLPPPTSHRASVGPESTHLPPNNIERERKPYASVSAESAIDDTNPTPGPPPPPNIERERNPYASQPGAGRAFADDIRSHEAGIGMGKPRAESIASNLGRSESVATKTGRSDSNARIRPMPFGASIPSRGPMEIPKPEIQHHRQPSNARRHRSPSFSRVRDDFRRSDGDLRGYQQTFQQGSIPVDGFDEEGRRIARERARRQAEDDSRCYGESPGSRARYERPVADINGPHRGSLLNEEDYYRNSGRAPGNGYDYQQPYGGSAYR